MHAVWHVRMSSGAFSGRTGHHACAGGNNLSGGQKQRLCIARALLASAKILIFDDSTSAVDTATEKKIRKELEKLGDVTKIIIAQRISSVIHTDRIVIWMTVRSIISERMNSFLRRMQFIRKFMLLR